MSRNVPDDMKDLVWTDEEAAAVTKAAGEGTTTKVGGVPTKMKWRKPGYITLPADWVGALKQVTPHPPWGVALYLVQKFVRSRENGKRVKTITVSSNALADWQIGPDAKVRDLRRIEAAGLIKIEPLKPGQLPRVTWLVNPEG